MSPGQTIHDLLDKARRPVSIGGAKKCWAIWPDRKRAWTYTRADVVEETDGLSADFGTRNILVTLADLWAHLKRLGAVE